MRAAFYTRTGPAAEVLELGEQPMPEPNAREVLVQVYASGINPADVKRRAGWNGMEMDHPLVIPHSDGAGVIIAVGEDVAPQRIGERVWLWNGQGGYGEAGRAFGTAATHISLPSEQAVPLPEALEFAEGACLGVTGQTAWLAVLGDGPVEGRHVLIQGAAGAVGQMSVQVALANGAEVLATVSTAQGAKAVAALGEVKAINRHDQNVAEAVAQATKGAGVNRIVEVDLAANLATDIACIAPHGMIASYSSSSNPMPTLPYYALANIGAQVRFVQGFRLTRVERDAAQTALAYLATSGQLAPQVGAQFSLEDIALAHARVEDGALGQTVLTLNPEDRS